MKGRISLIYRYKFNVDGIAIPIRIFLLLFLFRFDVAVFVIIFILFHHLTIFNNDNAVCHLGDGLVVGNHDQGLPILGNAVLED